MRSFVSWVQHIRSIGDGEVRRNAIRVVRDLHGELVTNFSADVIKKLSRGAIDISQAVSQEITQNESQNPTPVSQEESERRYKMQRHK